MVMIGSKISFMKLYMSIKKSIFATSVASFVLSPITTNLFEK